MEKRRGEKGEFVLLTTFALFVVAFLLDIRDMPMEGKFLSYLVTPFIAGLILLCAVLAATPAKEAKTHEGLEGPEAQTERRHEIDDVRRVARGRLVTTIAMACLLFAGILLFGFYLGSGLFLLVWFIVFRKLGRATLAITLLGPSLLYVIFEVLLDIGLPSGAFFTWLGS